MDRTVSVTSELELAGELMSDFARRTGLDPPADASRRYLWTDAFAVCNYLEMHRLTGRRQDLDLALRLVDQVHQVLGRHRPDDRRRGWISGLSEEEGAMRPTAGGLRIGKTSNERGRDEAPDPYLEWEQDGQYFHYLTKWMHALSRTAEATGEERYLRWAMDLAAVAQDRFSHPAPGGGRRMYWKMSIDLSYPLVPSMGQHDALDGYATYRELERAAERFSSGSFPDLGPALRDVGGMCRGGSWATDDPLGAGSLLIDALRIARTDAGATLLRRVLAAAAVSLEAIGGENDAPAVRRLAFRELGLSIGLHAAERLRERARGAEMDSVLAGQIEMLGVHIPLGRRIEAFWSDPKNRDNSTWREHEDINSVMLATCLAPGTFLGT
ncbi:MAG: hypothetical protein ISF22_03655 [Methanomassiliicoccus sp.]|nr:hypothetical protein [Methanomassiliicoccus sp.]